MKIMKVSIIDNIFLKKQVFLTNIDYKYFTNDNRTMIKRFIDEERTTLFDNENYALQYAKDNKSYCYPVYLNEKTTGYYAVPK